MLTVKMLSYISKCLKYIVFLSQTGQTQGGFLPPLKHYCEG